MMKKYKEKDKADRQCAKNHKNSKLRYKKSTTI